VFTARYALSPCIKQIRFVFKGLIIQHAKRVHRIILPSVACLALTYFFTLSHKRHDFREKVTGHKLWALISSTKFVSNVSHSKQNSARYYHKCTIVFVSSTPYFCHVLMKLEFSPQIVEKYSDIKFHENPSSGSRVVPCGRTDMTCYWSRRAPLWSLHITVTLKPSNMSCVMLD
jgi:hypothetical protein